MSKNRVRQVVYGWNFRGFKKLVVPLDRVLFLTGDNSSGKSSILHLINSVLASDLEDLPSLDEELTGDRFDYFSPYFQNADVTFGYEIETDEHRLGKLVTVRRHKDGYPHVTKASFFADETLVTIKEHGKSLRGRLIQIDPELSVSDIHDRHHVATGFSAPRKSRKIDAPPNTLLALVGCFDEPVLRETNILLLFSNPLPPARHLAPIRSMPEKFYAIDRKLNATGSNFPVMWRDLKAEKNRKMFDLIDQFGVESGLFEEFSVRPITNRVAEAPLLVTIKKNGIDFLLNQVGVGVSQVVPILVESIFATASRGKKVVLFQQPELHLHPVGQAALGTFFHKLSLMGFTPIIETHSNFLIDRFRSETRDSAQKKSEAPSAKILFCENVAEGNVATDIEIGETGKLEGPPKSYFAFFASELSKTLF